MKAAEAGRLLRGLREGLGLSQTVFWRALFLSQPSGSRIEGSTSEAPAEEEVPGLALHVLECDECREHFLVELARYPETDSARNQEAS